MTNNIRIIDITKAHILKLYKSASQADREWILERTEYWIKKKGEKYYFPPFRTEFARKFYPSLFVKKTAEKQPTLFDELKRIDEQIKTATQENSMPNTNKKKNKRRRNKNKTAA